MTITGPRRKDPSYTLRGVFVHSSANADAAGRARARKLEQAADDLDRLTRGLGSRHYPDAAKVTARLTAIAAARRVGGYLRADAGTGPDGRPTLQWRFDQAAIDAEAATDGWYALLTNLPAGVTAAQVLDSSSQRPLCRSASQLACDAGGNPYSAGTGSQGISGVLAAMPGADSWPAHHQRGRAGRTTLAWRCRRKVAQRRSV
jgi:hypothetical protein